MGVYRHDWGNRPARCRHGAVPAHTCGQSLQPEPRRCTRGARWCSWQALLYEFTDERQRRINCLLVRIDGAEVVIDGALVVFDLQQVVDNRADGAIPGSTRWGTRLFIFVGVCYHGSTSMQKGGS